MRSLEIIGVVVAEASESCSLERGLLLLFSVDELPGVVASSVDELAGVVGASVDELPVGVFTSVGERERVGVSSVGERERVDLFTALVSPSASVTSSAVLDVECLLGNDSSPEEQRELSSLGAAIASIPLDLPLFACVSTLESLSCWCF